MRDQEAVLRYFIDTGWLVICQDLYIKLLHENIKDFDIFLGEESQTSYYFFNTYGDLCVIIEGQEFALSKTTSYDIAF